MSPTSLATSPHIIDLQRRMQPIFAQWFTIFHPLFHFLGWNLGVPIDNEFSTSLCLQISATVTALASCLNTFTVPHAYYDAQTYNFAQPVGSQRRQWQTAVTSLLSVDGNCSSTQVPLSLQGIYAIEPFQQYCILYETASRCGTYLKGWGFMVVPASQHLISRNVHIAAPHPGFDLGTVEQAASIFESTGSNSLLVPGRGRTAYLDKSQCIHPTSPTQNYYRTDPAHNDQEPFFDASIAIYEWQRRRNGCPSSSCAFLQLHGKGLSTCPTDHIFLSSGLGNSTPSKAWYADGVDRPVKRLQKNLQISLPSWTTSLPSDSNCPLTATKNVVGRHLNGVHVSRVCSVPATSKMATGEFLHAEQAALSRSPDFYDAWSAALLETFQAACTVGTVLDPPTKLCKPASDLSHLNGEGHGGIGQTHYHENRWSMILSSLALHWPL